MKYFVIKTLGCKTNQLEEQMMIEDLLNNGFSKTTDTSKADFYILNSCTVTQSADRQVNYLLNKARRENPNIKLVLCGCAHQAGGEFEADYLLSNGEKLKISNYLKNDIKNGEDFPFLNAPKSTRVSVKIQDGCNNSCAYCIIPKARGKSRSNSLENIISQIEHISKLRHKEIVLTGIHIGQWGLEWGLNLLDLLKEIEKTSIHRYRLGSLYVNEIDDEMLEFLSKSKKFCPHFHLSLQSMSDKILSGMKRNYSVNDELTLIEKLHKAFKNPFIGCDIISGFPDENEEDFLTTYNNLKNAKVTKIHAFPYSKRQGTLASMMPNQVSEGVKKERTRKLIALSDELYLRFLDENMDDELEFIFEKRNPKTLLNKGVSRNYIEIFLNEECDLRGEVKNIKLHKKFLLL